MTHLRLAAAARGVDGKYLAILCASVVVAYGTASLAIVFTTPANRLEAGPALDSAVLIGLVLPVAILGRTLQNRCALMAETSPRHLAVQRATWLACLFGATLLIAALVSLLVRPVQLPTVVFWATLFLFDLTILGATMFGGHLSWLLPAAAALAATTPGLIPIEYNWLVLADKIPELAAVTITLALIASAIYVLFDDYGLNRRTRLIERQPGIAAE